MQPQMHHCRCPSIIISCAHSICPSLQSGWSCASRSLHERCSLIRTWILTFKLSRSSPDIGSMLGVAADEHTAVKRSSLLALSHSSNPSAHAPLRDASMAHCRTSACACIRAHSPLTTPSFTSAAALPPPPHIIVGVGACRAQCAGCAVLGGAVARRGGPTGAGPRYHSCPKQARASEHLAPRPIRACPRYQHTTTNKSGTKLHMQGAGRGAARYLQVMDAVPECTVCPAATTSGVPAKYSCQPALPYASPTRFHIKSSTPETAGGITRYICC